MRESSDFTVATPGREMDDLLTLAGQGKGPEAVVAGIGCPPLDADIIARLPDSVGIIATYSVGTDHIDLQAARRRGLAVSNTPRTLVNAVADAALFLILGAARRATESIDLIRSRQWPGWYADQLLGYELAGRTLGIYGMGEIGRAIAARARAFGMKIAYTNRRPLDDDASTFIPDPDDLVRESDVLLLAAPSTMETRGFIDARRLTLASPETILVNIARGDLVVDEDLIAALCERRIFAAALDVFNAEPRLDPRYFDLPNLFMTPHVGSSTLEARTAMGESILRSVQAWREGKFDQARLF